MRNIFKIALNVGLACVSLSTFAQDDLEAMMNAEEKPKKELVPSAFKGSRLINLQSTEKIAPGSLQMIIQHRFGAVNGGAYTFWGLDQATMRIGLELGISKFFMVGLGRSNDKIYDGFVKASLIRQHKNGGLPFSVLYFGSTTCNTTKFDDPNRKNYFSSRLAFVNQLIIAKRFTKKFSVLISPTIIHKNLVKMEADPNTVFVVGTGFRYKITKRMSINAEYGYRIPPADEKLPSYATYKNYLAVGVDIETGGHIFQLQFSNSDRVVDKAFLTENVDSWDNFGVRLGFNLTRDFVVFKP